MDTTTTFVLVCLAGFVVSAGWDALTSKQHSAAKAPTADVTSKQKEQYPPSNWKAKCHPLEREVSDSVHEYFLEGWNFRSEKDRAKFPRQGLATWHCYAFPEAKDDRIEAGARLSVILFLVDDDLEHMSLEEGSALIERIISIVRGDIKPDPTVPTERMMSEVWDNLASIDAVLTDQMKEPAITFWRSQVASERLAPKTVRSYLRYREDDIASELLCAIQRFSNSQHLPPATVPLLSPIHKNYSNCITVINDICSYAKEIAAAHASSQEGSALCSAVQVLSDETFLPAESAKTVLWTMCREWELNHERMAKELGKRHRGVEFD
ncbi:related to Aristolochene synthase [Cephalotrichum gorgonifer]|uniref:Related to Aristolochene synthase n=1 Tax=Cephalotrichum gorgonifer TaxID=2041049 RepID=A0AAE8MT98_9PEZI|nr:related to Aristolochene synthase [Cephalotrichum gorgonifer]